MGTIDRKKAIEGLKCCSKYEADSCKACPYNKECEPKPGGVSPMMADVLALLKEQEPKPLIDDGEDFITIGKETQISRRWKCGGCGAIVVYCKERPPINYCQLCGIKFKEATPWATN